MSFSHSSLSAQVKSYLTFLPEEIRQKNPWTSPRCYSLRARDWHYGKSGTGKSSLCNAIFQSRICATHPLNGCTCQAHRLTLQIGERRMTLVDLPGIGETPQHDQGIPGHFIVSCYRNWIDYLDPAGWWTCVCCRYCHASVLLNEGADPSRFSVCSQPCRSRVSCWRMGTTQKNARPVSRNSHWRQ